MSSVPDQCRFHDLRHTHAAICIDRGVNLKDIQVRLAHSSIRVTGDTYAHLLDSVMDRDMDALNAPSDSN